jgi:hypothetical protein
MKLSVPIEVDVNLTPNEIICYLKQWIYPILKKYQSKGSDWCTSKAIVKDGELYWQYQNIGSNSHLTELFFEEIIIQDEIIFNICKNAVLLLTAYQALKDREILEEAKK